MFPEQHSLNFLNSVYPPGCGEKMKFFHITGCDVFVMAQRRTWL